MTSPRDERASCEETLARLNVSLDVRPELKELLYPVAKRGAFVEDLGIPLEISSTKVSQDDLLCSVTHRDDQPFGQEIPQLRRYRGPHLCEEIPGRIALRLDQTVIPQRYDEVAICVREIARNSCGDWNRGRVLLRRGRINHLSALEIEPLQAGRQPEPESIFTLRRCD